MLCFDIDLLTVVCADVFYIPDIYVIIVVIFYFFLEPALMGLCPSGFQPPMANKYCCGLPPGSPSPHIFFSTIPNMYFSDRRRNGSEVKAVDRMNITP